MRKNAIDLYVKQLSKALESEQFEAYEEDYENLRGGFGMPKLMHAKKQIGQGVPANPPAGSYVGQYDFKIYMKTDGSVRTALPVPLFLPIWHNAGYEGMELPAGITIQSISTNFNGYEINYLQPGVGTQRVTVEGITSSLTAVMFDILSGMELKINKLRLNGGGAYEAFFSTKLAIFGRTSFGKTFVNDTVPMQSQQSPMQYQPQILDIDINTNIQKDKGLVYWMPDYSRVSTTPIIFSMFFEAIVRK